MGIALDEKVKQELVRVVGEKNVSDALMDLASYSYDFSGYRFRPQIAVWPTSTEQISEVMRIARRAKIPLVPRGAGILHLPLPQVVPTCLLSLSIAPSAQARS